jgi:hypothetical protein
MKFCMLIKNTFTLLITFTIGATLFLASCEDEESNTGRVELLSFGPAGVKHGEKIKFIGNNLDKVTAIILPTNVEVSSSQFVTKSREVIEIIIPESAEEGHVILKTPQGDIETKSIISFDVPVVINTVPAQGKPGTNITITGEFMNWVKEIQFYENVVVDEFVSQSLTELTVTVPMAAQTGKLVFSSGGTKPLTIDSEGELIVTLPAVTNLSPASIKHGETVTLSGTDLDLVRAIKFSGDDPDVTTFISKTATQIEVVVPDKTSTGALTLKVHSPVTVVTGVLNIILPVGTNVTPKPAVPGQDITISGTDLDLVAKIIFPGVDEPVNSFVSHSATEIVVTVPEGVISGGLVFVTLRDYVTPGPVFLVPSEDPSPLVMTLFDDGFQHGFGDWSWSLNSSDPQNGEQFKSGTSSWKANFQAWGGCQMGQDPSGAPVSGGLTVFSFSVYGGPGTDGALLQIVLNDTWGNTKQRNVVEGEWVEFDIPISEFPDANVYGGIHRVAFQLGADGVIWIDKIGFK